MSQDESKVMLDYDMFDLRAKALELSVSFCQTEALVEVTKLQRGEKTRGVSTPLDIIKRARQFEKYLSDESE